MTSDLCNDEVVVCVVTAPQIITTQSVVCSSGAGGGSRLATSSATVELGRRLLLAARAGDTTQVLDLMAKGAPFTTDWLGTSPLHLAAGNGYADTCGVLLRAGFSCEARTKVQRTPLHGAAQGGHLAAARTLLAAGAAPDARDMLRMTPLHWAAQRGHAPVVAELLAHGGDPSVRSKFQKSPRDLALAIGRADIVRMLDDAQQKRRLSDDGATIEEAIMEISNEPQFETVQKIQEIKQTKPKTEIKLQANLEELQSSAVKRDDLIKIIENAMKDRGTVLKSSDNIIDQMDVSTTESQVHFETVTKIQDEKPTKANPTLEGIDLGCSGGEGPEAAGAALLRQHGITLLPADDGSTVLTALQSGRTVVLSDAGKLMLKESSSGGSGSSGGSSGSGSSSSGSSTAAPAPLRPPPRGVKLFTLNNKLLTVPRPPDPTSQVKFVQLPPDVKIVSPSKLSAMKAKVRPSPNRPSVKIIMNKSNFNKLIANGAAKTSLTHNGVELVPETASGPGSGSPRQLRAQLQAAQRTIAELRAELQTCRERLAQYENL